MPTVLPANVPGDWHVNSDCIDCDACRILAPETFSARNGFSAVTAQPGEKDEFRAAQALFACPVHAIVKKGAKSAVFSAARKSFPYLLNLPVKSEVYFCGYNSPKSYGGFSYLVRTPEGNVMIDAPAFAPELVRNLEKLGGIRTMLFTHGDDTGDHDRFREHFGSKALIHEADDHINADGHLLDGDIIHRIRVIGVPGHTRGSVCFLLDGILFSGDHLAYWPEKNRLIAFDDACWYSWKKQIESMTHLAEHDFQVVLPGHGAWVVKSGGMKTEMRELIEWMKSPKTTAAKPM